MRSGFRLLLALGFIVSLAFAAAAQAAPPAPGGAAQPAAAADPDGRPMHRLTAPAAAAAPAAPGVALGRPGLAFRYGQTYGTPRTPYLVDTGHLNWPYSVAAAGSTVWIGEAIGRRALAFGSDGTFANKQIGQAGLHDQGNGVAIGELRGIALDAAGNIWLADQGTAQVLKYGPDQKFIRALGQQWQRGQTNDRFQYVAGVAVDAAGRIYVSDGAPEYSSDQGNHRIQIFNSDGSYNGTLGQTGIAGSSDTQFHGPRHIAVYGNRLYVADSGNNRVQIFDVSGASPTLAGTIAPAAGDPNHLTNPSGVAVDGSYIYVADTGGERVQIFDKSTLSYVATIGSGQWGSGANQFADPSDVAVDAAGNVYVADARNERVQQFSPARTLLRTFGATGVPYLTDDSHFFETRGVAANADGSFYLIEEHGARLLKLSAGGAKLWSVGEAGVGGGWNGSSDHFNSASAVAADTSGRAYVADTWNHRIQIFSAAGAYQATLGASGQSGTDSTHFSAPRGVFVAANNWIYVADTDNQRVQIFDANRSYVTSLGVPGAAGSDNAHFNSPQGVAVDGSGVIYVSDSGNNRIQVFGANRAYLRTIGPSTGVSGSDYGLFGQPGSLAVDAANNLYVANGWNDRVDVFDPSGAYLTSIGYPGDGRKTGQVQGVFGVAVNSAGAVFVASYWDPATVQKFQPGVPRWQQLNINGFGNQTTMYMDALASFNGQLYAGAQTTGAAVWRLEAGGGWSQVSPDGFGDFANQYIYSLTTFKGQLYASTENWVCPDPQCNSGYSNGSQVWRSADGSSWSRVTLSGFGAWNEAITAFAVYNDTLYAGTWGDPTHGAEVWRSADGATWEQVASNGFGDVYNVSILSLAAYGGNLYAGTRHGDWYNDSHPNGPLGGEVWRWDGTTWSRVNDPGFGDVNQFQLGGMAVMQNQLYAVTSHVNSPAGGAQVWRCASAVCQTQSDWVKVADNGFGVATNRYAMAAATWHDRLYVATVNATTGVQIWSTADGTTWDQTVADGLGSSDNIYVPNNAFIVHNDRLTAGTVRYNGGGGVWSMFNHGLYLPFLNR